MNPCWGDNCDKCIKGGLKNHNESVHEDRSHSCDKCGFPAAKRKKLKSHVETAHRDEDFNVTSVVSYSFKTIKFRK